MRTKETKRKILQDFVEDEWLHPVFVSKNRRVFRRISSPVALDLEDEETTLAESICSQLPKPR